MKGEADRSFADEALDLIETVVLAVFVFICVFTFVLNDVRVVGESMQQTLYNGDKLISLKFMYTPERGDVVIINSENMKEIIVKRIIGVPNDKVEIDYSEGSVYVNGEKLSEPYVNGTMTERSTFASVFSDPASGRYVYKVPFDKYLVLGDNRDHSTDGRVFGFVTRDEILGRAVFRYWSDEGSIGFIE